jgi:hypothetical protein
MGRDPLCPPTPDSRGNPGAVLCKNQKNSYCGNNSVAVDAASCLVTCVLNSSACKKRPPSFFEGTCLERGLVDLWVLVIVFDPQLVETWLELAL